MEFSEFLEMKYLEWQRGLRQRKTVEEFAQFIGVSQAAVSFWMGGKRKPSGDNVKLLASKLGPEVYDVLGLEQPDPDLAYIEHVWGKLPDTFKEYIVDEVERYFAENLGDALNGEIFSRRNPVAVPESSAAENDKK